MRRKVRTDSTRHLMARDANRLFIFTFLTLGAITYLFTPYTHNLDELKVSLTFSLGPLLLAYFVYLFFVKRVPLPLPPLKVLIPLGAYLFVMIISTLLAQPFCQWRGLFVLGKHIALLGLFFGLAVSILEFRALMNALYIFVLFILGTAIFGLIHYAGLFSWMWKSLFGEQASGLFDYLAALVQTLAKSKDMLSTILNRDFYANYLVMATPLVLTGVIIFESASKRLLSVLTLILMLHFCLYFTFSKDSLLWFVVTVVFFLIFYQKFAGYKKLRIPHLHIWIIGLLITLSTLIFFTQHTMLGKLKGVGRALESREIIWYGAWRIFLADPIVGGGPGCFYLLFPQFRRADYFLHDISNVTLYPHNLYLTLLAETGVLGFLAFLAFMGAVLYFGFRVFFTHPDARFRVIQLGLLTSIIGCLMTTFTSPNVRWVVVGTSFWALLGLSLGGYALSVRGPQTHPARRTESHSSKSPPGSKPAGWAIILLIATLCVALASNVFAVRYFIAAKLNNDGLIYSQNGRYKESVEKFEKAVKFNPTFVTSYYKLAHSYNVLGQPEMALNTYKRLQKFAPDYAEIHYNLGVVYSNLGRWDEAVTEFIQASKMEDKAVIKRGTGEAYFKVNKLAAAKEMFLESLRLEPDNEITIYRLAQISLALGQLKDAEKYYRQLYQRYPGSTEQFFRLVEIFRQLKQEQKIYNLAIKALALNPLNLMARVVLGEYYYNRNQLPQALEELNKAETLLPYARKSLIGQKGLYLQAIIYGKLGQPEKERAYLQRTAKFDEATSYGLKAKELLEKATTK